MSTHPTKEDVWRMVADTLTYENPDHPADDPDAEFLPDFRTDGYRGPAIRTSVPAVTVGALVAHCAAQLLHERTDACYESQTYMDTEGYLPQHAIARWESVPDGPTRRYSFFY